MKLAAGAAVTAALVFAGTGAAGPAPEAPRGLIGFVRTPADRADDPEIFVVDPQTRATRNLTRSPYPDLDPAWSPDGRRLAYIYDSEGPGLYLSRADGRGARLVSRRGLEAPAWSPTGNEIALMATIPGQLEGTVREAVYIWSHGRPLRRLTHPETTNPSWSPDGRFIVFEDTDDGPRPTIWVIGTDGHGKRRLGFGSEPSWSPDGRWIAFADRGQIRLMRPDGNRRRLGVLGVSPAWSPDGKWIAYARRKAIGHAIWIMRADGSDRRRLTDAPWSRDDTPAWRTTR